MYSIPTSLDSHYIPSLPLRLLNNLPLVASAEPHAAGIHLIRIRVGCGL